jgi:hypothetical protein
VNASGDVTLNNMQVDEFVITSNGSGKAKMDAMEAEDIQVQLRASVNVVMAIQQ